LKRKLLRREEREEFNLSADDSRDKLQITQTVGGFYIDPTISTVLH
jgi:hypothetical protein